MTNEDVKELQQIYISLKNSECIDDLNEANTSIKLVIPFLIKNGYDKALL